MASSAAHKQFVIDSDQKAFDLKHRKTIRYNMGKYEASVARGKEEFADHELARNRASYIKEKTIDNLGQYLREWEKNFTANGGKVIWAANAEEARNEIAKIFEAKKAKKVVKSKSMTTEEIHLNEHLEKLGYKVLETDLGEFIVQIAGQKPYHIVTPAMHLSKEDIAALFKEKLNAGNISDPTELTLLARDILRNDYLDAEIGISGGNFLVADVGGIALTENEGNARLTTTFPKTHIALVGIEKMVPRYEDLGLFWPMLGTSGTGQEVTVYSSVITGPKKANETDGPDEMIVVLLDNGRSKLLADPEKRQSLKCIRCGACLNACPVYRNVGGHTYGTTYSGPIGSVIMPHYEGMKNFKHLSHASSLCGACSSVCPVKIDIHQMLLANRAQSVDEGLAPAIETIGFKGWRMAMMNRGMLNYVPAPLKNLGIKMISKSSWSIHRDPLQVAPKSFNQLWKIRRKK